LSGIIGPVVLEIKPDVQVRSQVQDERGQNSHVRGSQD